MRFLVVVLAVLAAPAVASETCIEVPYGSAETIEQSEIAALYAEVSIALDRFPSLATTVATRSPELCFSSQMDNAQAYFDVDENRIYVSRETANDLKLGVLLHEIRHLDQFAVGACPSDDLSMGEYALATFALEADASAISLLIAWDMKEQGNPRAWSALSLWETQSDIATRFAEEMAISGNVEAAVSAAFDQWYASETRRELYYLSVCSGYLDRQDANNTLPRYELIPPDFYSELCKLPDGRSYRCSETKINPRQD